MEEERRQWTLALRDQLGCSDLQQRMIFWDLSPCESGSSNVWPSQGKGVKHLGSQIYRFCPEQVGLGSQGSCV